MFTFISSTMKAIWKKMHRKTYRDAYVSAHVSNTVAAQIEALREARGWKQIELAEKIGTKQSRISVLENPNNENFEVKTLLKVASAFDVGLSVRFVPYSNIVEWADNVSQDKLAVREFARDTLPMQPAELPWVIDYFVETEPAPAQETSFLVGPCADSCTLFQVKLPTGQPYASTPSFEGVTKQNYLNAYINAYPDGTYVDAFNLSSGLLAPPGSSGFAAVPHTIDAKDAEIQTLRLRVAYLQSKLSSAADVEKLQPTGSGLPAVRGITLQALGYAGKS